jgi:D-3-phosphoglycerate dehydrogenase
MKILVADAFSELGTQRLRDAGHTVVTDFGLKGSALTEALAAHEPQVLIVRSTKVTDLWREQLARELMCAETP